MVDRSLAENEQQEKQPHEPQPEQDQSQQQFEPSKKASSSMALNENSVLSSSAEELPRLGFPLEDYSSSSNEDDDDKLAGEDALTVVSTAAETRESSSSSSPPSCTKTKKSSSLSVPPSETATTANAQETVSSAAAAATMEDANTAALEERVAELETKLAVLSRLLQQQHQKQQPYVPRTTTTTTTQTPITRNHSHKRHPPEAYAVRPATPPLPFSAAQRQLDPSKKPSSTRSPSEGCVSTCSAPPPPPPFTEQGEPYLSISNQDPSRQKRLSELSHENDEDKNVPLSNQQPEYPYMNPSFYHLESPAYSLLTRKCLAVKDDDTPLYPEERDEWMSQHQQQYDFQPPPPPLSILNPSNSNHHHPRSSSTDSLNSAHHIHGDAGEEGSIHINYHQDRVPLEESSIDLTEPTTMTTTTTTTAMASKRKRNLSFRLLYQGEGGVTSSAAADLERLYASAPPAQQSMTPAERGMLGPQALQVALAAAAQKNSSMPAGDNNSSDHDHRKNDRSKNQSSTPGLTHLEEPTNNEDDENNTVTTHETTSSTTGNLSKPNVPDDQEARSRWLHYLNSYFQESTPDVDVQMQEFIKVPRKLEILMNFGFLICVDAFLYMITILPIRFVWSCLLLLLKVILPLLQRIHQWRSYFRRRQSSGMANDNLPPNHSYYSLPAPYRFHRRHSYQLIQVTILYSIYRYVLSAISIGKLYHWIRGQAMIKLYVLIAILEVFDRLFSSLGQDCLSSMYWNTVSRPRSSRMIVSVVVVWVYATLHALILFVHVATLNVAMNSADQALLTLLISGNFAEIKSTVFKKYNKPAMFKLSASDICERFKLGLFLGLVLLLNMCQGMEMGQFVSYMRVCALVCGAELLADWIKHSFISKFNFLPSKVYKEFALLLAGDFTGIGHEGVNLDHSHAVVKRIGFAQIPLVCVMFRLVAEAVKYAQRNPYWQSTFALFLSSQLRIFFAVCLVWLLLLSIKLALGRWLQSNAMDKLMSAPEIIDTAELRKQQQKDQSKKQQ